MHAACQGYMTLVRTPGNRKSVRDAAGIKPGCCMAGDSALIFHGFLLALVIQTIALISTAIFMPMPEIKISPCVYDTYLRADGHTGICGGAQTDAMHHHRLQRQLFPVFAEIIISSVCRDNSKDSTRRLNTAQVLG
jgi:hypothetical protein